MTEGNSQYGAGGDSQADTGTAAASSTYTYEIPVVDQGTFSGFQAAAKKAGGAEPENLWQSILQDVVQRDE